MMSLAHNTAEYTWNHRTSDNYRLARWRHWREKENKRRKERRKKAPRKQELMMIMMPMPQIRFNWLTNSAHHLKVFGMWAHSCSAHFIFKWKWLPWLDRGKSWVRFFTDRQLWYYSLTKCTLVTQRYDLTGNSLILGKFAGNYLFAGNFALYKRIGMPIHSRNCDHIESHLW